MPGCHVPLSRPRASAPAFTPVSSSISSRRIEAGEWTVNDQVPSENQLAGAVRGLAHDGAPRDPGAGPGRHPGAQPGAGARSWQSRSPRCPSWKYATSRKKSPSAATAIPTACCSSNASPRRKASPPRWPCRSTNPVYHSLILHLDNDVPVQAGDRYVNPRVAPDYIEQDFSRETPNVYLSGVAPLTAVEHTIEAILPDARVAGWLGLKAPQALPAGTAPHLVRRRCRHLRPPDPSRRPLPPDGTRRHVHAPRPPPSLPETTHHEPNPNFPPGSFARDPRTARQRPDLQELA